MKIEPRFERRFERWNLGKTVKLPKNPAVEQREEKRRMETRIEASLSGAKVEAARTPEPEARPPVSAYGTPAVSIQDAAALYGSDLEALRREGLPQTVDLEALERGLMELTGYDFMKTAGDIGRAIEELSSRCAVAKARIQREPESGEKSGRLQALADLLERQTARFAGNFADSVGAFYEKHGLDGERDRMYDSVRENVRAMYEDYGTFIKNSGGYGMIPEEDGWLRDCDEYMASELRRVLITGGTVYVSASVKAGTLSTETLSAAADLAKRAAFALEGGTAGPVSEEELGVRLGTMALEGYGLAEASGASLRHKEAVLTAFGARMDELLDESDRLLAAKRKTGGSASYPPLDRTVVASLVETMVGTYRVTADAGRALRAGVQRGYKLYGEKRNPGGAERYRESRYWERMFDTGKTGYHGKSNMERMLDSLRAVLPADVPLDRVFGTDLSGKA